MFLLKIDPPERAQHIGKNKWFFKKKKNENHFAVKDNNSKIIETDFILFTEIDDYAINYHDVTLALCGLSLTLNLSCLLVCGIQFLFAVKLVRAPATSGR